MKQLTIIFILMLSVNSVSQTYMKIEKCNGETDSIALSNIQKIYFTSLSDALVAYYPFEGSVTDFSRNGNDGTIHGGVTFTTDRFNNQNKAIHFDGISSFIEVPNSASLQSPVNSITLAGWINIESFSGLKAAGIIHKTNNSNYGQYNLTYHEYSAPSVVFSLAGSNTNIKDTTRLNLGTWYFITAVFDGNSYKLYVNGVLPASKVSSHIISQDNNPLTIGVDPPGEAEYFVEKLDDLKIYNITLSASEILFLYHEGGWNGNR